MRAAVRYAFLFAFIVVVGTQTIFSAQLVGPCQASPWPAGRIPYVIDANLSSANGTDGPILPLVKRAIEDWRSLLGHEVTFVECRIYEDLEPGKLPPGELTPNASSLVALCPDGASEHAFVIFRPGLEDDKNSKSIQNASKKSGLCLTEGLGFLGRAQSVYLGTECGLRSVRHEIGHVLGLYHEHQRPDRDAIINLNTPNLTNFGLSQFAPKPTTCFSGPYDVQSRMHYSQFTTSKMFVKNPGEPMWNPKAKDKPPFSTFPASKVGTGDAISELDVKKVRRLYGWNGP